MQIVPYLVVVLLAVLALALSWLWPELFHRTCAWCRVARGMHRHRDAWLCDQCHEVAQRDRSH